MRPVRPLRLLVVGTLPALCAPSLVRDHDPVVLAGSIGTFPDAAFHRSSFEFHVTD